MYGVLLYLQSVGRQLGSIFAVAGFERTCYIRKLEKLLHYMTKQKVCYVKNINVIGIECTWCQPRIFVLIK